MLNLTFPTEINFTSSFENIFYNANSTYKVLMKNSFISFSPECFIKIKKNKIFSYPMKGTISALVKDAENKILNNKKELWEHNTIVDLIRNDLATYASNIKVTKFRYLEKVLNAGSPLLQVVSEVKGDLDKNWKNYLGNLIWEMLPAGSISGAPKLKTIDVQHTIPRLTTEKLKKIVKNFLKLNIAVKGAIKKAKGILKFQINMSLKEEKE